MVLPKALIITHITRSLFLDLEMLLWLNSVKSVTNPAYGALIAGCFLYNTCRQTMWIMALPKERKQCGYWWYFRLYVPNSIISRQNTSLFENNQMQESAVYVGKSWMSSPWDIVYEKKSMNIGILCMVKETSVTAFSRDVVNFWLTFLLASHTKDFLCIITVNVLCSPGFTFAWALLNYLH